MQLRNRT